MIQRINVKCLTCGTISTLRIDIGHSKEQKHVFNCSGCGEEIEIKLDLSNPPNVGLDLINNCECCDEEGIIENLSSENQIPESYRHDPFFSPGIFAAQQLFAEMKEKGVTLDRKEYERGVSEAERILRLDDEWPKIKRAWSQFNKNNITLADNIAKQNSIQYPESAAGALHWSYDFCARTLCNGRIQLLIEAKEKIYEIAEKYEEEFDKYLVYHSSNVKNRIRKYYSIFERFFDAYSEYSQLFISYKLNRPFIKSALSSYDFAKTRDFYGFSFEVLGSGAVTFAAIQNIEAGREYDTFATKDFTLDNYLQIDKVNRIKCFERIPEFINIYSEYNVSIRNGSHHATFEYDPTKKIISYQPKKDPQKIYTIDYFDYINGCVELLFSCSAMVCIDILLFILAMKKQKSKKSRHS